MNVVHGFKAAWGVIGAIALLAGGCEGDGAPTWFIVFMCLLAGAGGALLVHYLVNTAPRARPDRRWSPTPSGDEEPRLTTPKVSRVGSTGVLATYCPNHRSRLTTATCQACRTDLCADCLVEVLGKHYCQKQACQEFASRRAAPRAR